MKPINPPFRKLSFGFTLIELLVVIAILGILASMLLPVFSNAKDKSRRANCMNNLKQVGLALQMYASDNEDNLPRSTVAGESLGSVLWDLPKSMADGIAGANVGQHNLYRRIFYCPGAFTSVQDEANWWDYTTGHRVTSYQWLISRDGSQSIGGRSLILPKGFLTKITKPFTNQFNLVTTEVVTDVVPSQGAAGNQTDSFVNVTSVNPTWLPNGFNASHMARSLPKGGNILFLDNHVEWRPFREMECRFRWSTQRNVWF